MPEFRGKRSVYSPEWANAAELGDSRRIYEEMYTHLAAVWTADSCAAHYISMFANDPQAIEAWHWLGFGTLSVDAIRGLQPIEGIDERFSIRKAGMEDLEQILMLNQELRHYMKSSPVFFLASEDSESYFEEWLEEPGKVIWLASIEEEPVAFMSIGPANDDACTIIYDERTTSINGAYTREPVRGQDIATAVLDHALRAARSSGYERCAVDFESMNLLGTRFWLRHFRPVCFSLLRYVDDRVIR
jgi:GNAT superfamily N-acetyltransferase